MLNLDERITRYIAKCPPAISGSDGHGQTFAVACTLYNGFALDEAETLRFLKVYNDGCQPPWMDRDLRHKVNQAAAATHTKPRGHLLGQAQANWPIPVEVRRPEGANELRTFRTIPRKSMTTDGGESGTDSLRFGRSKTHILRDVCARTHHVIYGKIPSEARVEIGAPLVSTTARETGPSEASEAENPVTRNANRPAAPSGSTGIPADARIMDAAAICALFAPLIPVSGCNVGRPPEIELDDETWRAVEAAGFASEAVIQEALWRFGPGCRVVTNREEQPA